MTETIKRIEIRAPGQDPLVAEEGHAAPIRLFGFRQLPDQDVDGVPHALHRFTGIVNGPLEEREALAARVTDLLTATGPVAVSGILDTSGAVLTKAESDERSFTIELLVPKA